MSEDAREAYIHAVAGDIPEFDNKRFLAATELLGRTGADKFRIGYSSEEDGEPVVWYGLCTYPSGAAETAAGMDPVQAVMRLCAQVIDGGRCRHCKRVTAFVDVDEDIAAMDKMGTCVYGWDKTTESYRRTCDGHRGRHGVGGKKT